MPPEYYEENATSLAWDLWSLGIILTELITQKHPFPAQTAGILMRKVLLNDPEIPNNLPSPFKEIITGCLIKDRSQRWTAQQVLEAIKRSLNNDNTRNNIVLITEGANYEKLDQLLGAGNWEEADLETGKLMKNIINKVKITNERVFVLRPWRDNSDESSENDNDNEITSFNLSSLRPGLQLIECKNFPIILDNAHYELSNTVIGQEQAIASLQKMLIRAKIGLNINTSAGRSSKPKGVFFFIGPTGVGKTELAKALTKLVFGNEEAFARFDMSEYREENADQKLIGAPPGFVGYEKGGQLTNRVIEQPYSILLFDEIEKAHPKILDKFLQILDDGRLTDSKGQTAYFNQTVIIFTSNIGASNLPGIMNRVQQGSELTYQQVKAHFQEEFKRHCTSSINRPELLGRLSGNVVVFDLLRPEFVDRIGKKLLQQLKETALDKYGLNLNFDESIFSVLSQKMAEGDNLLFGGRRIKTILETLVEYPLNEWLFDHYPDLKELNGKNLTFGLNSDGELILMG